jgi:hypothetical protein
MLDSSTRLILDAAVSASFVHQPQYDQFRIVASIEQTLSEFGRGIQSHDTREIENIMCRGLDPFSLGQSPRKSK